MNNKILHHHSFVITFIYFLFVIILFLVWSYNISSATKNRDLILEQKINNLSEDYEKYLFQADQNTKGRWSIDMQDEYTTQMVNFISGKTNSPPDVFKIKEKIEPSLP